MQHKVNNQGGFTIIELLLALAFFSFVLLFAVAGFIQINRSYNKGLTVKRVHESGRIIIEDVARTLRTAPGGDYELLPEPSDPNFDDPAKRRFCVGGVRLAWNEMRDTVREEFGGMDDTQINLVRANDNLDCDAEINKNNSESYLDTAILTGASAEKNPNEVYGGVVVADLNFIPISDTAIMIELSLVTSDPGGDLVDLSDPDVEICKGALVAGEQFCDVVQLVTTVSIRT